MKLIKFFLIFLFSLSYVLGQDIGTTEVKVVEGFNPKIPDAFRLNENAIFFDTINKDRTQKFEIVDVNLKSDYKIKPLSVAKIKDDKISELYATKFGVSFGLPIASEANLLYNSKRSRNLSYGVIANHFANKYYLAKNTRHKLHVYAKKINSSYILLTNFDYERKTALYFDEKISPADEKFFRNRFSYTKFMLSAISKETLEKKLKHHTTFFVSDFNEFSENQIHLSSNLSKTLNNVPYDIEITFDNYLRYNNADNQAENTDLKIFRFSPNCSFKKFDFDFDLAFKSNLTDDLSLGFFPMFKATKELVKDVLLVYGGLSFSETLHTLKSLSDENPYIHSFETNQTLLEDSIFLHELEITYLQELYLGMRNVLDKGHVLEASIAYGIVTNFAHFINYNTDSYNRYRVLYVDENVKQLHLHSTYLAKLNEILDLNLKIDYFNWDIDVYNKPLLNVNLKAPINLRDKIKITPSLTYNGKRRIFDEFISEIPAQFHANLSFHYIYSKQLSAYIRLNNLTNTKEYLWFGYREIGFNGLFGASFSL